MTFTHTGVIFELNKTRTADLREAGKLWIDSKGKKFLKENGRRPLDGSNGIRLLLDTVKEK